MAKNVVKRVINIPNWYKFSDFELRKLYSYVRETSSIEEAQWFRFLDCATFCGKDKCFFSVMKVRANNLALNHLLNEYTLQGHLGTVNMASENSAEIEEKAVVSDSADEEFVINFCRTKLQNLQLMNF